MTGRRARLFRSGGFCTTSAFPTPILRRLSSNCRPIWYMGSTCHVGAFHHVAGIDPGFSDIVGLARDAGLVIAAAWAARYLGTKMMATKAGAAFGGWGAAVGLAVDIWDWLTWDTSFYVAAGPGAPWPPPPIPTPPATPSAPRER